MTLFPVLVAFLLMEVVLKKWVPHSNNRLRKHFFPFSFQFQGTVKIPIKELLGFHTEYSKYTSI